MEKTGSILEELKTITHVLASIGQSDVYTVPNGYFEHLINDITARINEESLFPVSRSSAYQIPEGYFESFSDKVFSKISIQENSVFSELQEVAPLLNTISKKNIYSIPSDYFENLKIIEKKEKTAKIISFSKARKWISYAAAASISGLLFTGGFLYEQQRNNLDVTKELNKVSDSELNAYVENGGTDISDDNNSIETDFYDIKQNLKSISEDDLQQYLKDSE